MSRRPSKPNILKIVNGISGARSICLSEPRTSQKEIKKIFSFFLTNWQGFYSDRNVTFVTILVLTLMASGLGGCRPIEKFCISFLSFDPANITLSNFCFSPNRYSMTFTRSSSILRCIVYLRGLKNTVLSSHKRPVFLYFREPQSNACAETWWGGEPSTEAPV